MLSRRIKPVLWLIAYSTCLASNSLCLASENEPNIEPNNEPAKKITFRICDTNGTDWKVGGGESKGTVIVVISADCPIANSYQPELQRFKQEFAEKGLQFLMIHANPELSSDKALEHAQQYAIQWGVCLDPDQSVVRQLRAEVIPTAFLLSAAGQVVYRGRIDDRHVALGRKKPKASRQDLRLAIEQYLAGEPIQVPATTGVGCRIKY